MATKLTLPLIATLLFVGSLTFTHGANRAQAQDASKPAEQGQAKADGKSSEKRAATTGDAEGKNASGEDVVNDLLKKRRDPILKPTRKPTAQPVPAEVPEIDPRVVGTAPGGERPKLRAEGEFIVSRRGRLLRAKDGVHFLFVFDADSKDAPEAPMIMMPCQLLESMEKLVRERGDSVRFKLTGQVFVYKGANYVLPSIMRIAPDKGNLQK